MYYLMSKTIGFFALPTNAIACLAVVGLLLLIFRRPLGKTISIIALSALIIAGLSPLGNLLLTPLEQRFPGLQYPQQDISGIIVLGGSYDTQIQSYVSTITLGEDSGPIAAIADLARRYPAAKIVFSGGDTVVAGPREAELAKQLFVSFGIDEKRILLEDRSRNTEENARFTAQLLRPAPRSVWLLVTAAYHMPRAMGSFRHAGFNVIAFPTAWRTHGWRDFFWPQRSVTENLRRVDVATREWVGLTIYRLLGYSAEWFPAKESIPAQ